MADAVQPEAAPAGEQAAEAAASNGRPAAPPRAPRARRPKSEAEASEAPAEPPKPKPAGRTPNRASRASNTAVASGAPVPDRPAAPPPPSRQRSKGPLSPPAPADQTAPAAPPRPRPKGPVRTRPQPAAVAAPAAVASLEVVEAPGYTRLQPEPAEAEAASPAHDLLWRSGLLNVVTIARRELGVYLGSPLGYAAATFVVVIISVFGYISSIASQTPVSMGAIYRLLVYLMVFFVPATTMRQLAEEKRSGTLELLLTSPARDWEVVVGKWLGAFVFYIASTVFVFVYVLLLAHYSQSQAVVSVLGREFSIPNLEYGPVFTGYLAVLLAGAMFLAVGLLVSSLTSSQLVAVAVGWGVLLLTVNGLPLLSGILLQPYSDLVDYVSTYNRMQSLIEGQIVLHDVVYFLSVTAALLFLAVRVLESRKWR